MGESSSSIMGGAEGMAGGAEGVTDGAMGYGLCNAG